MDKVRPELHLCARRVKVRVMKLDNESYGVEQGSDGTVARGCMVGKQQMHGKRIKVHGHMLTSHVAAG